MPRPFLDDLNDAMGRLQGSGLPYEARMELAYTEVRDDWMARGHLDPLIAFVHYNWDSGNCDDFIAPLATQLLQTADLRRFARLWKGVLRRRLDKLHGYRDPQFDAASLATVDVSDFNSRDPAHYADRRRVTAWHQRYVLAGLDTYIAGLRQLGAETELAQAQAMRADAATLRKPAPRRVRDRRRIDEALFWILIEEARATTEDTPDFIEMLAERLSGFAPAQIRAFNRHLDKAMARLNHHDVWALAYISQGGCGDDAFADFRAWAISRGQAVYAALCDFDPAQPDTAVLTPAFAREPAFLEEMQYVADRAHEAATGEPLPFSPGGRPSRTRGRTWCEDQLGTRYPALVTAFG